MFGKQECRDMYIYLKPMVSTCLSICVCSNSSLKPEDQCSQSLCGITIGWARKVISNDSGHLLSFIIVSPREGGTFSRDFTTSLAPECRAFSGALKIEKLKAPLIPGPEGAVDTNDWCITENNVN